MSDNASDKIVTKKAAGVHDVINSDAYQWKDGGSIIDEDSPSNFWDACYGAIAHANHALEALEKLETKTALTASLRSEALMTRAYSHFMLANLFCMRYDPSTASTVQGIPYSTVPEVNAIVKYHRETMEETYRLIEKDLTEGLPGITDDYEKPKYHFNIKASHAFAARFYLYKGDWNKVIEHASLALGDGPPETVIRNFTSSSFRNLSSMEIGKAYSSVTEKANLLIGWVYSTVADYYGGYQYGLTKSIVHDLFEIGSGNPFNKNWAYRVGGEHPHFYLGKYQSYFKYTDEAAGIAYIFCSIVHFTTDEALLNRAEAWAMLNRFEEASRDLTSFLSVKTEGFDGAVDKITPELIRTAYPPKEGEEYRPFYTLSSEQEAYIKCIAEMRRREFCHEGIRWFDIKRFNLEIVHKKGGSEILKLPKDDPRRAIQIPQIEQAFGLPANSR